ncbi:5'-3' exonuclease isoform X2 [Brassica napus]|uniref:5'-3' exonuclease isoform X2 n=1 Tax=Brassica napus TaxID=3708 RepID=UPI000BBF0264|nr:5'-3' exonuclease isoform X2 [Brassica napus]
MEKKVTSYAESYCLHIKRIGNHQILGNTPKGHTNSLKKFLENAMCQWVVRIQGHEADDVVATLMEQAVQRGHRAVIASPDKDFKQLISENVQIVIPLADLRRWSFYTLKHYHAQYNCDPQSDLSFRCIMGDEVDGVPGIQHVVPAFGRKTAMKLVRKHGSLESLLSAAAVRTVGRPYAQEALTKYADYLRRNYQVLALKRDVKVQIEEQWLVERDTSNDSEVLSSFFSTLHG